MNASLIAGLNPAAPLPQLDRNAATTLAGKTDLSGKAGVAGKTRAAAEEFESVFLNSMLQQMFANVGEGAFSGGPGAGVWRSFLTDEYAKSIVKSGGIGIADHVQRALLAQQEQS